MREKTLKNLPVSLKETIDSMEQSVVVVNIDNKMLVWNSVMEQNFLTEKDFSGKTLNSIFPAFWEEYKGEIWGETLVNEVIKKGNSEKMYRFPLKTAKSQIRYFDLKASPLKNNKQNIIGAILTMNDVTDSINLEKQLLRQAKTASLANLGASIAHEIRNPLNSISLNIQLIKEWILKPEVSQKEMIETVDNVLSEINRLNDLIRYFLKFSRLPEPELIVGNIDSCVQQALKLLYEQAKRLNVDIIENLSKTSEILMDKNLLSQAIYNICLNGIQAMKSQGGGRLEISSFDTSGYVMLEIKDNGHGFLTETKDKLFELFFTTKEDGSGLGLPIANQIIEKHDGKIVAENNLDRGACFSIYFPIYKP